jgi:hypothetical protein
MAISNRSLRDFAAHQQPARRDSQFPGGLVLAALGTLVLGAVIGVAGYFLFKPSAPPAVSEAVLAATGRREAEVVLRPEIDDGEWTDADLRRCGDEAAAARDDASKRKLAAVSADRVGLGAPDPKMVERSAFLLCSIRGKPRHLCEQYWHGKLIEAVKQYATDFRTVAASAYWTKVTLAERVRADTSANSDLRIMADDIDQTTRDVAKMHDEIATALRALVANGILEKADFGKFLGIGVPPDISELLGDEPAVRNVCG